MKDVLKGTRIDTDEDSQGKKNFKRILMAYRKMIEI